MKGSIPMDNTYILAYTVYGKDEKGNTDLSKVVDKRATIVQDKKELAIQVDQLRKAGVSVKVFVPKEVGFKLGYEKKEVELPTITIKVGDKDG